MIPQASARIPKSTAATWQWKAAMCGAFALAVWGAKLWIIAQFATPTPVNDEWDVHALGLFAPYVDSTLSFGQLLAPHNEHRTLTTRVLALLLFVADGAWDPILEMILNAAIHVALGVGILLVLGDRLGRGAFAALALTTAVALAAPNASENPVWGLETHFYCVLLFGFIAIVLIAGGSGSLVRVGAGIVAATLSFLSLASGALVFLACATLVVANRCLGVERGWRPWATAGALLACCAVALALTPIIEAHRVYRAQSVGQFVWAFEMVAAWPFRVHMTAATVLVNAPLAILAWRSLREPASADGVAWALLGLGLWNGLQFAALAFGRSLGIDATRYLDICAVNLIVNFACAALLADSGRRRLVAGLWIAAVAVAWAVQTARRVPQELAARHDLGLVQERNVRTFVATGAFPPGASGADLSVPYPNAARLAQILSDPKVRRVLPSIFRDAVAGADSPVAASAQPDRLSGVRDALLRAGPFLAGAGTLLMALMMMRSLLVGAVIRLRKRIPRAG
jgi:hypothetical protein